MSRRIVILICALPFAVTLSVCAQHFPNDSFAWQDRNLPSYSPPAPWTATRNPNPRFPITVLLSLAYNRYDGDSFVGAGKGHVFNPRGEDLAFKYRCGITFTRKKPVEFYGRWITPDRKLEILLGKPGTNHTRTCRISTSDVQVAIVAPKN